VAGGAVPTFLWSNVSQILNKYLNVAPGAGGASGSISTMAGAGTGTSGAGGRGGGGLIIECNGAWNFTTASGISVAGANGAAGSLSDTVNDRCGAGGGGAGGVCLVLYRTLTANSGTITISGGTGANHVGGAHTWIGGGGGGGSVASAGSDGLKNQSSGVKDGGDGAAGVSMVAENIGFS